MNEILRRRLNKLKKYKWAIKEYGLEDDPNEEVQYVIFEKDHNWFYFNIWPKCNHKNDAVTISPHVDEDGLPYECSVTLNVDEFITIARVIDVLHDIKELEEINGQNN